MVQNISHSTQGTGSNSIAIPTSEGFEIITTDEIRFLVAESNYTLVHLKDDKKYLVSKTLKEVAGMIAGAHFFRAHKSYIANLNNVRKYVRGRGGYLVMKDGQKNPVSWSQRQALLKYFNLV